MPDVWGEIPEPGGGGPVQHCTEFFNRSVEEGLLPIRERPWDKLEQLAPVWRAREQVAVPPDCARLKRDPLGVSYNG